MDKAIEILEKYKNGKSGLTMDEELFYTALQKCKQTINERNLFKVSSDTLADEVIILQGKLQQAKKSREETIKVLTGLTWDVISNINRGKLNELINQLSK